MLLLINPPNIEEPHVEADTIPIGLVAIREFFKENGLDVTILNLFFTQTWNEVKTILEKRSYNIVGIPCYTRQRFSVIKLTKLIKEINPDAIIVLGGPHATFLDIQLLQHCQEIDYIVRGAGEKSTYDLYIAITSQQVLSVNNIENLTYRKNGTIVRNVYNKDVNLALLPIPLYNYEELLPFSKCESLSFHFKDIENLDCIAPLLLSRGCNNRCLFCCNGALWDDQNYYPVEAIIKQVDYYYIECGVRLFDVYDDDLLGDLSVVIKVCDHIINNGFIIKWWCSSRADHIDEAIISKMKAAGCFMVSLGLESGSDQILRAIEKNVTLAQYRNAIKILKINDMLTRLTVSIGHPGENEQSIDDTIEFIREVQPDQLGLFLVKIYPGTTLYDDCKLEYKITDEYWFDCDNQIIPFYYEHGSLSRLIYYRDKIKSALADNITTCYETKVFCFEMDLVWNE